MAKDKEVEAKYKAEGLRRITVRQQKRKDNWTEKVRIYGRGAETCPMCGHHMTWCGTCQEWSSECCQEYGDCQCS
jgi:hypothetical protein